MPFSRRRRVTLLDSGLDAPVGQRLKAAQALVAGEDLFLVFFAARAIHTNRRVSSKSVFADQDDDLEDAFGVAGGGSHGFGDVPVACEA